MADDYTWDNDGVLNSAEPLPRSFVEQVQVMQCNQSIGHELGDGELLTEVQIMDFDEQDTDEDPTSDRVRNLGGVSAVISDEEAYEGAYIELDLVGGTDYTLVVGANETGSSAEGFYEIVIQKVD